MELVQNTAGALDYCEAATRKKAEAGYGLRDVACLESGQRCLVMRKRLFGKIPVGVEVICARDKVRIDEVVAECPPATHSYTDEEFTPEP